MLTAPSAAVDTAGAVVVGFFGRIATHKLRLPVGTVRRLGTSITRKRGRVVLSALDAAANTAGRTGPWRTRAKRPLACGVGQLLALRKAGPAASAPPPSPPAPPPTGPPGAPPPVATAAGSRPAGGNHRPGRPRLDVQRPGQPSTWSR